MLLPLQGIDWCCTYRSLWTPFHARWMVHNSLGVLCLSRVWCDLQSSMGSLGGPVMNIHGTSGEPSQIGFLELIPGSWSSIWWVPHIIIHIMDTLPETNINTWKWMVGILVSFGDSRFLKPMSVLGSVHVFCCCNLYASRKGGATWSPMTHWCSGI